MMANSEIDHGLRGSVTQINNFEFKYEHKWVPRIDRVFDHGSPFAWIDSAWAAMLIRQGIIPERHHAAVARVVCAFLEKPEEGYTEFAGLERWVTERVSREAGGSLTIGRTVPPLRQMAFVRHELLKMMCVICDVLDRLLDAAGENLESVMPGYTHIRHAQPTTFGHYLLSVYDPMERAMAEVENGYRLMSLNEIGCGALAGTSLPIDRDRVTEYLGLDALIENANDAVSYTDGYVTLVAAIANLNVIFSRFALDLNVWSSEECGFMEVPWVRVLPGKRSTHSHSHFMPNKTNNSPHLERSRVAAAEVMGALTEVTAMGMRAPHADMHEMLHMADGTLRAIRSTVLYILPYIHIIPNIAVDRERMLQAVKQGWAAATELGNRLVLDHGLDYRTAHEVLNEFINESKKNGIPATEARIEDLDTASEKILRRSVGMTQERLRESLDPDSFVRAHNSKGGVAPEETGRMLKVRRERLADAWARHGARIDKLEKARSLLRSDLESMTQ